MAHEILEHDSVLSIEGTEWHGLADHVSETEILQIGRERYQFPLIVGQPSVTLEDGSTIKLDEYQTVLADIRNRNGETKYVPLHNPKTSYRPISNEEIINLVVSSLEKSKAKFTTMGTLDNLKYFFISVDLNPGKAGDKKLRAANGDQFKSFLNFRSSHNGTLSLEIEDSFIRIVCMNTFKASRYSNGAMRVVIPHTKNAGLQINNMSDYLNLVLEGREKVMESMGYLLDHKCSEDEASAFVSGFLSDEEDEELTTTAFNRTRDIVTLYRKGIGNKGESRYDLFNGLTEFFTHHEGAGGKKADKKTRLTVSQFGRAAEHKENALYSLLDEDGYKKTVERGGRLYAAKSLAMGKP